MTQPPALAQNTSCAGALAAPPAATTPMSSVALSPRCTWYSAPSYAPYSARVMLWAATHGVPAAP